MISSSETVGLLSYTMVLIRVFRIEEYVLMVALVRLRFARNLRNLSEDEYNGSYMVSSGSFSKRSFMTCSKIYLV